MSGSAEPEGGLPTAPTPRLRPVAGEPAFADWRERPLEDLAAELTAGTRRDGASLGSTFRAGAGRIVVAVDGRSGSGKSTLAEQLRQVTPEAILVHTDDLAWHAPMFGWADIARGGVLDPFHRGQTVSYRPPAWDEHGRDGSIEIPAETRVLYLEGVGSSQLALRERVDRAVWVQSDLETSRRLGLARDIASGENGDEQQSRAFWDWWESHEMEFLNRDRPWERADVVVAGVGSPMRPGFVRVAQVREAGRGPALG